MGDDGTSSGASGTGGLLARVASAARGIAQQVGERLPDGVTDRLADRPPGGLAGAVSRRTGAAAQTLTLSVGPERVLDAVRDPQVLDRVLGDLGRVERVGDLHRWTIGGDEGGDGPAWDSRLVERADGLRFTSADAGDPSSVDVALRTAPADLGTEVRLALDLPVPAALAGTAAFTVLYRLRSLLQTGEIATLGPQPAARPGQR